MMDKIVDKYSGYYICNMEFDESETYDDKGWKMVTHSVINDDSNVNIKSTKYNYTSKIAKTITKILKNN